MKFNNLTIIAKMKNILYLIIAINLLTSCTVSHNSNTQYYNQAIVTNITPIYINTRTGRYYETRCQNIYVNNPPTSTDIFTGMVIGGIAGNAIGRNDRSTTIGAILGGLIASNRNRQQIVGTRCHDIFINERPLFSHYRIEYVIDGKYYFYDTQEYYSPGTIIYIQHLP
jgi:uncharacterized protein YcfJ